MDQKTIRDLAEAALKARDNAYIPYSNFSVGAALLTEDGTLFTGCNIENKSYPAGICAERTAIFSAAAAGKRSFRALAVAGGMKDREPRDYCMPCGICRQVMSEFCGPDFEVAVVKSAGDVRVYRLDELLPHVFDSL